MENLKKEARKAYFDCKIPVFLNKIQAESEISEEVLREIESYFSEFRVEEEKNIKALDKYLPEGAVEATAPKVSDLFRPLTTDEQIKMGRWLSDVDDNMRECIKLAREQKDRIAKGQHIDSKKLLDLGLFFITNEFSFNQVLAYRERLYKVKIAEIIDNYNISRREAQDRAEITQEYFEFNVMRRNLETLKDLELIAKKYNANF
jgi:hypothetical protein